MTTKSFASLLLLSFALATSGCSVATQDKAPPSALADGKADGEVEVVDQGPIELGESVAGELEPGYASAYSFEIAELTEVSFETGGDEGVDTVLYLETIEGAEVTSDDDGGNGLFSKISETLLPGAYRIVVAGYNHNQAGAFELATQAGEGQTPPPPSDDPWAGARDVNMSRVHFTEATPIPESYMDGDYSGANRSIRLGTAEWWQRWSGGHTQSFGWGNGTDYGKRCAVASAIRLESIVATEEGQEAFNALFEAGWAGKFYNWSEDISEGGRASGLSPAGGIWAWTVGSMKWNNVTHTDGSCDLATLETVQRFVANCTPGGSTRQGCKSHNR